MPRTDSFDRSELADFDDHADFEGFLFSQEARGVQITAERRDNVRRVLFFDDPYDSETVSADIPLRTTEW